MDFVDKDFPILLKINIKINKILENSLQTYLDHGFLDFNLMDVNS
jgi:hypothetical protein